MSAVKFYDKTEDYYDNNNEIKETKTIEIEDEKYSLLYTKSFVEKYICVYLTTDDIDKFELVKSAFDEYIEKNKLLYPGMQGTKTVRDTNKRNSQAR